MKVVRIRVGEFPRSVPRQRTGPAIELMAYRDGLVGGELRLTDHDAALWVPPQDPASFVLSEPDRALASFLKEKEGA